MQVCDRCKKQGSVIKLSREFSGGGIEICFDCDRELDNALDTVEKEIKEIRQRRRRAAFVAWYGSKPVPKRRWWERPLARS